MTELDFNQRGICFLADRVLKKWPKEHSIERWASVYEKFQDYDARVVKVLDVNYEKNYFEMELVTGIDCEKQMYTLSFEDKKRILIDVMDIHSNFFKFTCKELQQTEIFVHLDFRIDNLIYTKEKNVKLIDPDSFGIVPLDRMNNHLYFGKYIDTLYNIKEKLGYRELDPEVVKTFGRGYTQ